MPAGRKVTQLEVARTRDEEAIALLEPSTRRALERGEMVMGTLADFGAPPLDPETLRELRKNARTYSSRARVKAR